MRYLRGTLMLSDGRFCGRRNSRSTQPRCTIDPAFDGRVRELVRDWGVEKSAELTQEIIVNLRPGTGSYSLSTRLWTFSPGD